LGGCMLCAAHSGPVLPVLQQIGSRLPASDGCGGDARDHREAIADPYQLRTALY
jgi:hypothetical protein